MAYPRDKRQRATFHAYGHAEFVETGSTATNLTNYGVSRTTAGIYVMDAPAEGVVKYLILESSDSQIQTNSTTVTIGGTTNNEIAATTDIAAQNEMIMLIGLSTALWGLGNIPSTGWALAATTGVN